MVCLLIDPNFDLNIWFTIHIEKADKIFSVELNLFHTMEEYTGDTSAKIDQKEKKRQYRLAHKEEIQKSAAEYYKNNREKLLTRQKEYREAHKNEISEKDKKIQGSTQRPNQRKGTSI